jgi:hypothetical protein
MQGAKPASMQCAGGGNARRALRNDANCVLKSYTHEDRLAQYLLTKGTTIEE